MIKIMGAIIITFACGGFGIFKAQRYARRPIHLRKLRSALQNLETEIAWTATPLPEALNRVGEMTGKPVNFIFTIAGELIKKNAYGSVGKAWEEALSNSKRYLAIGYEEMEILKNFGYGLGNSHVEEQIKNLTLTREHLKSIEKNAEEEKERYEKMYRTMGFLIGMAISLILV